MNDSQRRGLLISISFDPISAAFLFMFRCEGDLTIIDFMGIKSKVPFVDLKRSS